MLFGYPLDATADNWLHDSVIAAVKGIHELVEGGKKLPAWPGILPEENRVKLKSRRGLKDRLSSYATALRKLTIVERQQILDALVAQNKIPELLDRQCDCEDVTHLPEVIREPLLRLFTFAFGLLSEYEVRQRQYAVLYKSIPAKVCPFCGCEGLDAPGAPQEDLDHYIPRSKYPFAAANLRNLPPMGGRCNTKYKLTQDPLRRADDRRRRACDPFLTDGVTISIDNSVVDETTAGPVVAEWTIEFDPTNETVETWDEIFHVRERWTRDVLKTHAFSQWLDAFRSFCRITDLGGADDADAMEAVRKYAEIQASIGFDQKAFMQAAFFRFLHRRCAHGCQRLLPILRDLTGAPQPIA